VRSVLRGHLCATLLLAAGLLACGGGKGHPSALDLNYQPDTPVQDVGDAAGGDDLVRDVPGDQTTVAHRFELILLHDTSQAEILMAGGVLPIRAKAIDYAQNTPAAGLFAMFEITQVLDATTLEPSDDWDANFETDGTSTDAAGLAVDLFRGGLKCNRLYTLQVSLPDTDALPKSMDVLVACAPVGCLDIDLKYDGALPASALVDMDVYILPSDYDCDVLSPERGEPDLAAVLANRSIANLYGTTTIENLAAENRYTVFALGHRKGSPCVVASACIEGVYIAPQLSSTCDDLTLEMYLAVLSPTGQYDCIDHFDFTNLVKQCAGGDTTIMTCVADVGDLGKTVCCVLAEMIKFFETPGYTIVETIQELAKQWLGSLLVDTVFNLFKDAVAKIVTNWLLNNSPPFIQDFFTIGGDMMGAITNLEMMSNLRVSKLGNDYSTQGDQYWHGLALYWKFGCDPQDPNYDSCGRIELDLQALNDPLFPTDLLGGKFTAIVADFDKWIVNQHAIKLNYGKLVLYVLNDIIFPAITGKPAPVTLLDIAHLWINCAGISQGIIGEIFSWFGGSAQDVEGLCNTAVNFLFGFVDVFLNGLSLDTEMSVSGTALLVDLPDADQHCDLKADEITKGKYLGYVQGTGSQASITGDFECDRK
jgi:hypothetical protein